MHLLLYWLAENHIASSFEDGLGSRRGLAMRSGSRREGTLSLGNWNNGILIFCCMQSWQAVAIKNGDYRAVAVNDEITVHDTCLTWPLDSHHVRRIHR